jgi:hypothetical protein
MDANKPIEDIEATPLTATKGHSPSLPLYHFERRFVVDLEAQIFKSDGQMPTVYPPQIFDLEFTGKFRGL